MASSFQHGLCGCCDNCTVCICSWFCSCYVGGKIAEKVGDSCCLCGLAFFFPITYWLGRTIVRGKVRQQKGIPGGTVMDCLTVFCCGPCTICQEAQEVGALDSMSQSMVRD